jgi:quercetin dioxygenase-like cupin family protein
MNFTKHANIRVKALKLANLISYRKGSIVSREIINKKTGTVTIFAFDKDESLSEHTVPFDALVYILDGEAMILISGKPYSVKRDEIITMPANKPHSLRALKKFKMLLIMIRA